MALYRVTLPDGSQYNVTAPEGTSERAIRAAAQRFAIEDEYKAAESRLASLRAPAPAAPPETTFGGNVKEFFKGLAPGAVGLGETAATGLAALLPESAEKAVRGKVGELAQAAREPLAPGAGYEESVGRKLGEALGSTIPFFALRGRTGAGIATGIGASAGAGEARQAAEAAGATEEQRRTATAAGIVPGLFDAIAPNIGPIKGVLTTALVRGGIEGATEAAQKIAQNLIAQQVYNPEQEIFVGAGEEGAYGAGAGALASLLIDMTLGRKARQASTQTAAAQAQAQTQTQAQPPAAPPPAEPVTSMTAIPPSAQFPQGELFRQDITRAREARAQPSVEEGRPEFALTPPEPAMEQMELPFGAPAPEAAAAPQQRDLIDELETAQIREMVDQDETQQIQQMLAEDAQRREFEAAVAAEPQQRREEDYRINILRTIIDEPSVTDIKGTFIRALEVAGFPMPTLSPREETLIARAEDFRATAKPPRQPKLPVITAPSELAGMEALIPERREKGAPQAPKEAPRADLRTQPVATGTGTAPVQATVPSGGAQPAPGDTGVAQAPQPTGLGVSGEPAPRPDVGEAAAPVAVTAPAPTPAAPARSADDLYNEIRGLEEQRLGLLRKDGRIPFANSPARKKHDELADRIDALKRQWAAADTAERKAKATAPAPAPAPAPVARDYAEQVLSQYNSLSETQREAVAKRMGMTRPQLIESEAIFNRTKEVDNAIAEVRRQATAPQKKAPKTAKDTVLDQAREGYLLAAKGNVDRALDYLAHDMAYAMYPEKNVAKELNKITLDLVSDKIEKPKFGKADNYVPNTGGKFAKAFFESLSLQEYKALTAKLRDIFQDYARTDAVNNTADKLASARKEEELSNSNGQTKYGLNLEAPILGMRMHPAIQDRLAANDLAGALRVLSGLSEGRISTVASRVADYIGQTKVVLSDNVTNEAGKPVAGRFDPTTNTITLNTSMGMSSHTLLHEGVHAVTSHVLDNPSHPITKQLTALYKNAVPYLDTAYGARSLDEFVAEAFSNPDFQFKLSGIPAEGNTTVFQRFIRAVQNLVRRLVGMNAQPVESVMDATDRLVYQIMAPAPDSRGAGSLYAASATGNSRDPLDIFSKNAMAVPTLNQERIYKFRELFSSGFDAGKTALRSTLPLNALVDIAKDRIPMATKIGNLIDERAGAENNRNQMIEPIIKRTVAWAEANPTKLDSLNKVIYASTLYQVDPSKSRDEYVGKTDDSGNKLDAVWDRMNPLWQSLGQDGRSVYKQMRDTYASLHKEVERVLYNRIDDALKDDPSAAKSVKQEIYKRLFESGKIEPYFPLTRTGKYWLSYNADGEFYVEAYETAAMREDAIKELSGTQGVDAASIQKFANISQINYRNVPPTSFVNSILQTLEANKKGASPESKARIEETISEVMNLFLNTLPETSFAQSFRRRKGTLGFNQDAVRALRSKTYNMSRQLANIEYGAKLESARSEMQEHVKANGSQEVDAGYMDEFNKRIDFAISPHVPGWSRAVTSAGFAMTLGFNLSSAVINLAQIPIVVAPYFGGRYGYGATTMAIGRATKIFAGSGLSREAEMLVPIKDDKGNEVEKSMTVGAAPSIDNYDFSDPKNADIKHLETLVKIAGARGQLNRSMAYDILDADPSDSIGSKLNRAMGFAFHHGERMNRQVAMVAAYELELSRLTHRDGKLTEDLTLADGTVLPKGTPGSRLTAAQREEYAANQAIYMTELVNGGTSSLAAPRIAQSALGRILFMYKRYGVSMYYMLFKTARDALKRETDPEIRKAAWRQLGGVYASAALMAGVQGVPLYGIAAMLYDMFTGDDEDKFDAVARKTMAEWGLGEIGYSGVLNAITGADIAARIGMGDLLFRDTLVKNKEGYIGPLIEQLGGPVLSIASRVERGIQLINEGYTVRGVEQMLPSAFSALSKAYRFGTEGALTLRGDPIVQEFGGGQVVGQVFGFTPAEYTRRLEINSAEKGVDRAANEMKTKLLRNYYVALRTGDMSGAQEAINKMSEFNQRHPSNAITEETIKDSMAQHMKTSREMVSGVLYSKNMRPEIMRELARFEGTSDEED